MPDDLCICVGLENPGDLNKSSDAIDSCDDNRAIGIMQVMQFMHGAGHCFVGEPAAGSLR